MLGCSTTLPSADPLESPVPSPQSTVWFKMSGIEICAGDVQAGMLLSVVKDAGFAETVTNCVVTLSHAFHFDFSIKISERKPPKTQAKNKSFQPKQKFSANFI